MLKGQKKARAKKGQVKVPELKGSNFKCLRGIDASIAESLLAEVSEGELALHELNSQCLSIKQLSKVQAAFTRGTNSDSWENACSKFPRFTSAEQLEPFKKLNFNSPKIPTEFMPTSSGATRSKRF